MPKLTGRKKAEVLLYITLLWSVAIFEMLLKYDVYMQHQWSPVWMIWWCKTAIIVTVFQVWLFLELRKDEQ